MRKGVRGAGGEGEAVKKRYLWVVEAEDGERWVAIAGASYSSRKWAQRGKRSNEYMFGGKYRIVKYVPEKP